MEVSPVERTLLLKPIELPDFSIISKICSLEQVTTFLKHLPESLIYITVGTTHCIKNGLKFNPTTTYQTLGMREILWQDCDNSNEFDDTNWNHMPFEEFFQRMYIELCQGNCLKFWFNYPGFSNHKMYIQWNQVPIVVETNKWMLEYDFSDWMKAGEDFSKKLEEVEDFQELISENHVELKATVAQLIIGIKAIISMLEKQTLLPDFYLNTVAKKENEKIEALKTQYNL